MVLRLFVYAIVDSFVSLISEGDKLIEKKS